MFTIHGKRRTTQIDVRSNSLKIVRSRRTWPTVADLRAKGLLQTKEDLEMGDKYGVQYYYHFRKDLTRPYGLAFDSNMYTHENFRKVIKTVNCEFLHRPLYAISEMAATLHRNYDFVKDNETPSFFGNFFECIDKMMPYWRILDRQCEEKGIP